jgi:hypothetical protein
MMSSDSDFKDIGLPKGVRMKILKWANENKNSGAGGSPIGSGSKAGTSPTRSRLGFGFSAGPSDTGATPKLPDSYCCPISHFIMDDPVQLRGGAFGGLEKFLFFYWCVCVKKIWLLIIFCCCVALEQMGIPTKGTKSLPGCKSRKHRR